MKKVNCLLGILYAEIVLLLLISVYIVRMIIPIVAEEIFQTKIAMDEFDDPQGIYEKLLAALLLFALVFLTLAVINIASLFANYKKNDSLLLFAKMKKVKLFLIPYWIIKFICYAPLCFLLLAAGHGFGFIVVPILIYLSHFVLLVTSSFSIAWLISLRKNGVLKLPTVIIHIILQTIFVADIVDTLYIAKKWGSVTASAPS